MALQREVRDEVAALRRRQEAALEAVRIEAEERMLELFNAVKTAQSASTSELAELRVQLDQTAQDLAEARAGRTAAEDANEVQASRLKSLARELASVRAELQEANSLRQKLETAEQRAAEAEEACRRLRAATHRASAAPGTASSPRAAAPRGSPRRDDGARSSPARPAGTVGSTRGGIARARLAPPRPAAASVRSPTKSMIPTSRISRLPGVAGRTTMASSSSPPAISQAEVAEPDRDAELGAVAAGVDVADADAHHRRVAVLRERQRQAVESEDYDTAADLKAEIARVTASMSEAQRQARRAAAPHAAHEHGGAEDVGEEDAKEEEEEEVNSAVAAAQRRVQERRRREQQKRAMARAQEETEQQRKAAAYQKLLKDVGVRKKKKKRRKQAPHQDPVRPATTTTTMTTTSSSTAATTAGRMRYENEDEEDAEEDTAAQGRHPATYPRTTEEEAEVIQRRHPTSSFSPTTTTRNARGGDIFVEDTGDYPQRNNKRREARQRRVRFEDEVELEAISTRQRETSHECAALAPLRQFHGNAQIAAPGPRSAYCADGDVVDDDDGNDDARMQQRDDGGRSSGAGTEAEGGPSYDPFSEGMDMGMDDEAGEPEPDREWLMSILDAERAAEAEFREQWASLQQKQHGRAQNSRPARPRRRAAGGALHELRDAVGSAWDSAETSFVHRLDFLRHCREVRARARARKGNTAPRGRDAKASALALWRDELGRLDEVLAMPGFVPLMEDIRHLEAMLAQAHTSSRVADLLEEIRYRTLDLERAAVDWEEAHRQPLLWRGIRYVELIAVDAGALEEDEMR